MKYEANNKEVEFLTQQILMKQSKKAFIESLVGIKEV